MYAVAIALKYAVTVTYGFYSLNTIERVYFYFSWVFWCVVVVSTFASFQIILVGQITLERKEFVAKKLYERSVMKLLKDDAR